MITVVSGSGGAGKSTVASLLSLLFAQRGLKVLLLDGDFQFGDMRYLVSKAPSCTLDKALQSPDELDGICAHHYAVLAAPRRLEYDELIVENLSALLDVLIARFDIIVVNTGSHWTDQHATLIERSAKTIFLIDQRASSIRACQHAVELCMRCGIATGSFIFAINHCSKNSLLTSIDVSCAMQGANVVELKEGGSVVEELLGSGYARELIDSGNDLCQSLESVIDEMLPDISHLASARRSAMRASQQGAPAPQATRPGAQEDDVRASGRGRSKRRRSRAKAHARDFEDEDWA